MHTVLRRRGISGSESITSPPDPKVDLLDPNACRHPALMAKDMRAGVCRNLEIAVGKLPTVSTGCDTVCSPCHANFRTSTHTASSARRQPSRSLA